MEKQIEVKVCLGTSCYVMGSSYLQELVDIIPAKFGDKASVLGHNCLGQCSKNWEYSEPPYVQVDEEIIPNATIEKVIEHIERKLK
jgi:NADH:ubiquinone oxidoreductase subunit E